MHKTAPYLAQMPTELRMRNSDVDPQDSFLDVTVEEKPGRGVCVSHKKMAALEAWVCKEKRMY